MDKIYRSSNEECSEYQAKLVEIFDTDPFLSGDKALKKHLDSCPDCQSYLQTLRMYKEQLNQPPLKLLHPDPLILKKLIAYKNTKNGLKSTKINSILNTLRQLFEYRIPVYQALGGVVVGFMLFLFISGPMASSDKRALFIDYSGDDINLTSSELYLADSLSMDEPHRGQNAKEDSVLMSFLVSTM